MRRATRWIVACQAAMALAAGGCDGEPTTRPMGPAPTLTDAGPPPGVDRLLVDLRIEPGSTVEGFSKTLVVQVSLIDPVNFYWNNDGKPPTVALDAPDGVRLSAGAVVFPNTAVKDDTAPRVQRIGLDEDPAAGTEYELRVTLQAYICNKHTGVCLAPRQRRDIRPTRAP